MAGNEPTPPLNTDESVNTDTSVETNSAPCAKAKKSNFKWNPDLELSLASVVG